MSHSLTQHPFLLFRLDFSFSTVNTGWIFLTSREDKSSLMPPCVLMAWVLLYSCPRCHLLWLDWFDDMEMIPFYHRRSMSEQYEVPFQVFHLWEDDPMAFLRWPLPLSRTVGNMVWGIRAAQGRWFWGLEKCGLGTLQLGLHRSPSQQLGFHPT